MNRGPGIALDLPRTQDGRPILSRADLEAYDPTFKRSGGRDRFFCPVHGSDTQQSLSVDPQTGHYTCHSGACQVTGVLREHWPSAGGVTQARTPAPSIMQIGQQALARREHADAERAARLAAATPPAALAFLARLDAMSAALRDPACPGALYLRQRGLDPVRAAERGAGYAEPNAWPGDYRHEVRGQRVGMKVGRVVYPLADPATGRIVSAMGRLCVDADPAWSEEAHNDFMNWKQRKLRDCPAGVWPYASMRDATAERKPLVLVEGPADALALVQQTVAPARAMALLGTSDVLPAVLLRDLPGVVLALDDDDAGVKAARALRVDLTLAGVRVEMMAAGWLHGAKDLGELAAVAADTWGQATHALTEACRCVQGATWNSEQAVDLIAALYRRLGEASRDVPPPWPDITAHEDAIDAACQAQDWDALETAIAAAEARFRAG